MGMLARKGYPAGLAFDVVREALAGEGSSAAEPDLTPGEYSWGQGNTMES